MAGSPAWPWGRGRGVRVVSNHMVTAAAFIRGVVVIEVAEAVGWSWSPGGGCGGGGGRGGRGCRVVVVIAEVVAAARVIVGVAFVLQ